MLLGCVAGSETALEVVLEGDDRTTGLRLGGLFSTPIAAATVSPVPITTASAAPVPVASAARRSR